MLWIGHVGSNPTSLTIMVYEAELERHQIVTLSDLFALRVRVPSYTPHVVCMLNGKAGGLDRDERSKAAEDE